MIVVDGDLVRVKELDYCPFALDYNQESYIIEVYSDRINNRLMIPTGELPQWLHQGMGVIAEWQEANKDN